MICDNCGDNNAIMHIRQVVGNEDVALNLCEKCARENGFEMGKNNPVNIAALLDRLRNIKKKGDREDPDLNVACPFCSTTLSEVKKSSNVGCSRCYDSFSDYISSFLAPGSVTPVSARARRNPVREIISEEDYRKSLEMKLEKAVSEEDYEEAAVLRDKIRALGV